VKSCSTLGRSLNVRSGIPKWKSRLESKEISCPLPLVETGTVTLRVWDYNMLKKMIEVTET